VGGGGDANKCIIVDGGSVTTFPGCERRKEECWSLDGETCG
jgi:hypothetical protein